VLLEVERRAARLEVDALREQFDELVCMQLENDPSPDFHPPVLKTVRYGEHRALRGGVPHRVDHATHMSEMFFSYLKMRNVGVYPMRGDILRRFNSRFPDAMEHGNWESVLKVDIKRGKSKCHGPIFLDVAV
jgi:CMP-2-keto-3-deoxyoctulosonic acid synthetase